MSKYRILLYLAVVLSAAAHAPPRVPPAPMPAISPAAPILTPAPRSPETMIAATITAAHAGEKVAAREYHPTKSQAP
jgi:hypothetical protein